jgi:hypothetical protein
MNKLIILLLFSLSAFATDFAGSIIKLRGSAFKLVANTGEQVILNKDSKVHSGDLIITSSKSFVKLKMTDDTSISIASNTTFKIKEFLHKGEKRKTIFNLVHGKYRAKINRKVKEGQEVTFGSRTVSVGVRGTEFFSNAYAVSNAPVGDVALLKGNVSTNVLGKGAVDLTPGKALNTNALKQGKNLTSISAKNLEAISANEEYMLPEMQKADGSFVDLNKAIEKDLFPKEVPEKTVESKKGIETPKLPSAPPLPVGVGLGVGISAGASKVVVKDEKKEEEKEKKSSVKIVETNHDKLKNEPWDIKDAMLKRKQLMKENRCFYWIYKTLPGRGAPERFRRERDCDEFRNEL